MAKTVKEATYGSWLAAALDKKGITIPSLAEKTGLTYMGIWNIINENTLNPRKTTRESIEKVIGQSPEKSIVETISNDSKIIGMGNLEEFTPYDPKEMPEVKGVYVFYDAFERPVYVGKAIKQTIKKRIDQHKDKFWFRDPIVTKARYIEIADPELCSKVEMLLIRFLGSHNFLNKRGADSYKLTDVSEDT